MDNGGGGAAPTGCYKCGRPGHWSRDCPSNPNPNPDSTSEYSKTNSSTFKTTSTSGGFGGVPKPLQKSSEKSKKVPRSRPKLTPELLLSDDGLGYVLRHFPRAFKYRGRGHEVSDLGNLIGLYAEWNSHLIPYYPFDQFVNKVEQVGATRRVKTCLGQLRERVSNGGDPTKLHELPVEQNISNNNEEAMNMEEPCLFQEGASMDNHDTNGLHEDDMVQETYEKTTEEPSPAILHSDVAAAPDISSHHSSMIDLTSEGNQAQGNTSSISTEIQISEDQKARMEANRIKALERAAARARSLEIA